MDNVMPSPTIHRVLAALSCLFLGSLFMGSLIFDGAIRTSAADLSGSAYSVTSRSTRGLFGNHLFLGERGLEYKSSHNATSLWLGMRFQTRYDTYSGNLATIEDLQQNLDARWDLRRGRIKGGGTLFREWLEIYSEYNFPNNTLLDFRATVTTEQGVHIRWGQWKSEFNRERVDSSGKQQLVERSLSNYWFTVDRQPGLVASKRFAAGSIQDTSVWTGWLSGQGRGGGFRPNSALFLGRAQWNPAGEALPFSQSDLVGRPRPLPSLAIATVLGRTPFSRFSSGGGQSLPGFEVGDFDLSQLLVETALHYLGWSWQQELHWKNLHDRDSGNTTRLLGGYAQLGTFPNYWCACIPPPLEFVGRFSLVDPDRDQGQNNEKEWTAGVNWFINGHRNKLTCDLSFLDFESPLRDESQSRFRFQWELSI